MKNRCLHTLQLNRPFMIRVALIHCVTYSCDCCISAQQFTVTPQTCWFIGVNSCPSLHRRRSVTFDALLTTLQPPTVLLHGTTIHTLHALSYKLYYRQAGRQAYGWKRYTALCSCGLSPCGTEWRTFSL